MDALLPLLLASVAVFAIALVGLAVGVIFSGRCLRGSCGGAQTDPLRCAACPNRRAP